MIATVVVVVVVRERGDVSFPRPSAQTQQLLADLPAYLHRRHSSAQEPMFCAVRYLGASGDTVDVYEACLSWRRAGRRLVMGAGWWAPAAITVVERGGRLVPVDEAQPAFLYDPSERRMFPSASVRREIAQLDEEGMPPAIAARLRNAARAATRGKVRP